MFFEIEKFIFEFIKFIFEHFNVCNYLKINLLFYFSFYILYIEEI